MTGDIRIYLDIYLDCENPDLAQRQKIAEMAGGQQQLILFLSAIGCACCGSLGFANTKFVGQDVCLIGIVYVVCVIHHHHHLILFSNT